MGVRGGDTGMPESLFRLKDLKKLDIFNSSTTTSVRHFEQASEQVYKVAISPAPGTPPASPVELVVVEDYGNLDVEKSAMLIFFGEENERFKIGDLLSSEAVLQGHNFYSSLYKVTLNSNAVFAVKRLRKLQISIENFRSTMTWIGKLKHPNLLPLVACHASEDEQLLIYRFQTGNLSNLLIITPCMMLSIAVYKLFS